MIKGLFIKEPWITLILDGKKSWEIRGANTKIRGRIALIASGSGQVKGYIDIVDSIKLSSELFDANISKHNVPKERYNGENMPYKKTHAWIFSNPKKLDQGIPFTQKKVVLFGLILKTYWLYQSLNQIDIDLLI